MIEKYATILDGVKPWSGEVPQGYLVDFLGTLTDARFRSMWGIDPAAVGGAYVETRAPIVSDGEVWFEAISWAIAAEAACARFVMMSLGAHFGSQAVGSYRLLQLINPMPCKLIAVEPGPENFEWTIRHFRDNGIDPDDHWLVPLATSDRCDPVLFPVGSPETGAQNCVVTNRESARKNYAEQLISSGRAEEAVRSLLMHNTTGISEGLVAGQPYSAEIKLVSAITLRELLGPFERVDLLESDIQMSEILVFPPCIDLLRRKVKLIHIGTHGKETHRSLHKLFANNDWEVLFSFEPNARHETSFGSFETNDGVLTVRNRKL